MSKKMNVEMGDFSDGQLVELAKKGDVEAFAELARRYQDKIYNTVLAFTKNPQDADDLAQEAFMHAFKSLKKFKQSSSLYTWLYAIAVNLSLNFLKKRKKDNARKLFSENDSFRRDYRHASASSPEKESMRKELDSKLREAIESLPLPYKASFILVVFQGMSHGQAARILRCSENTVSWRMHKARKMLQAKLGPYLKDG
jgi:RNA polymerase sigma-70 factor (ECF subfamily)